MLKKATTFLEKYNIIEFPIPIDIIKNIISHEGIKIEVTKYLKKSSYYEDSNSKIIYLGCKGCKINYSCQQREYLVHETAHIYHCGNTALLPSLVIDKNEGQAQAFAAYFLMPFGLFEVYLTKGENEYDLSERFGVTQELVRYRKKLLKSILESGYYKQLKRKYFFKNYSNIHFERAFT